MYKQDDKDFPLDVQKYGCYFFCILRMCEIESGHELCKDQIIDIYTESKAQGFIGAQCSVQKPDELCRAVLMELGTQKTILQTGQLDGDKMTFWGWAKKPPYNQPNYIALRFATSGPTGWHYVLGNMAGKVIFDSSTHDYTMNKLLGGLLHTVT